MELDYCGSWGHCRCQSSWSWFTAELVCRGLPWLRVRLLQVKIRRRLLTQLQQLTELTQWTGRTVQLRPAVRTDHADTSQVVSTVMHTAGDTGPQSTQLTDPLQPPVQHPVTRTISLERVQTEPWKLPVQPTVSVHDGNTALPPVSVPIMVGLHQTWQLRWEPASCNSKRRMSIGSNHKSLVHWTSRCCFPDCNLCSSPQLLLVHWSSRPRMLSPWRQPCGWWWIRFYNNSSVWFILAVDLEHLGHLFIRMQAHP